VSALSRPQVGQYLNRHFVASFQKVGTFQINGVEKQGGNVASYFCTPKGRVLHAVAGPVNAALFAREAQWANETYQLAMLGGPTPDELRTFFRKAHLERLQREHGVHLAENRLPAFDAVNRHLLDDVLLQNHRVHLSNEGKMHLLLAVGALPRLEQVYQVVFERVLNEKVSTNPVAGR
jgi:hypothetical protein